ncbi:integration host factor subunit beta [Methylophilaceae bacterium]|jgi:integration host factor subunit beta|nr:integration host factor subunit beta [Methylophilaceae bacterium]|tara:strand:- start:1032 stop:1310 length:279 start_codon:yes stop_codon:yes gene_type:complete
MTKSKLINLLASRFSQLVHKDAELSVKTILDAMSDSLMKKQRIEIRGFGSFSLNYRSPRIGRNPKSGEKVNVPEKYVPHFKAGKELRARVDK